MTAAPAPATRHEAVPPAERLAARVWRVVNGRSARLLVSCELASLALAVMTGPDGSSADPVSGFTGSLGTARVWWFVGLGLVLFVLRTGWRVLGEAISAFVRAGIRVITGVLSRVVVRLALEAALVAFGVADVTWLAPHDTWKGGYCVQVGVALLALELGLFLGSRFAKRWGRGTAYAALAAYGGLARLSGGASRYLGRTSIVLHNPVLGKVLLAVALLGVLGDVVAFASFWVAARVEQRRPRRALGIVGALVVIYGFFQWTTWSQWQASTPDSIAHWLANEHLLVHARTAGVVVMCVGAAMLACAFAWIVAEIAGVHGGSTERPPHPATLLRATTVPVGRSALAVAALLLAIEWPLHMDPASVSNLDLQIMPFVLMALGLNVVIGFAGLLDLGYVAFYALGAYVAAFFTSALSGGMPPDAPNLHPPFVLDSIWAIPFAIAVAVLAGVILGFPTLRLRGDYLAIVTLGFGEIIYIFANNWLSVTGGPIGSPGSVPPFNFHISIPFFRGSEAWSPITYVPLYYLVLGVVVLAVVVFGRLGRSRVGRTWAAIREDEAAADSLGVNALKYKVMAFAIGASTGGLAGVFLASQTGTLFPGPFVIQISITVVACVIFGGMGSIPGAIIGAIVVNGLPAYLQQHNYTWYNPSDFALYLGALLIVMMIFRPQGLIPSRQRRTEMALVEGGLGPDPSKQRMRGLLYGEWWAGSLTERGPIEKETL